MKWQEFLEEQGLLFLHLAGGEDLFGTIHHVPGIGCIGMEFFHLSFIPILPQGCYVYLVETDRHHAGKFRIKLRMLCLFQTWFRTLLLALPICYGLYVFWKWLEESEGFPDASAPLGLRWPYFLVMMVVGVFLFFKSFKVPKPDSNELRLAIEEAEMPEDRKQDVLKRMEEVSPN